MVIKNKVEGNDGKITTKVFGAKNQSENSEIYRSAFNKLIEEGWNPDYVISHSGWGCGTYVKVCWPKTKLISYLEWWFNPESKFYKYDETNKDLDITQKNAVMHWKKNQLLALELSSADKIIAPTKWQRNQLPESFKSITKIAFDGIDIQQFKSKECTRSAKPLVTYGTRGMEPVRAFKQFIKEIPSILTLNDQIEIEIAGYDELHYGGKIPKGFSSWGNWAKHFLQEHSASHKVKWMGYLSNKDYCKWLKRSWCHVYLTHPYILSWSFLEAFASGCPIVCSNVEPVQEFAQDTCIYIDHRLKGSLYCGIKTILEDPDRWVMPQSRFLENLCDVKAFENFMNVTGLELSQNG